MRVLAFFLVALVAPVLAVQTRGAWTTPIIESPRFAEVGCGTAGRPACERAMEAVHAEQLAMLQNGLPGHDGEADLPANDDPLTMAPTPEKKPCTGQRTPEEEALGLNPGASPCEVSAAKKMMCKEEEECEENLVIEEENAEAERAELQEMGLDKQVATLERLISHAKDIQNAIPAKMRQLEELKRKLGAAEEVASAKQADGELERQRAFLLEVTNKITELKEKLEELEMTKERTEKTIHDLEEQANGLAEPGDVVGSESGSGSGSASASGSGSGSASASGSGSGSGEGFLFKSKRAKKHKRKFI